MFKLFLYLNRIGLYMNFEGREDIHRKDSKDLEERPQL